MTQNFNAQTATFSEQIRLFNSEVIPTLVGQTVTAAEPADNLDYKGSPKCGLKITLSGGGVFGLFRWDLVPSKLELVDDKLKLMSFMDALHKAAKDNLRPGVGEKQWLEAIASAVKGKTVGMRQYIGRNSKGSPYPDVVLTID